MSNIIDHALALEKIRSLLKSETKRTLIGVVGKPGSGKSTFTKYLKNKSNPKAVSVVPMDGFHLSNKVLSDLKRLDRKGAPDTFDVSGFISLLQRIREESEIPIYYPIFDRAIEESISGQGVITPDTRIVIVEGNYLLHNEGGWERVSELLDEIWILHLDDDKRIARLIARHIAFGKSSEAAKTWAKGSDQANAILIEKGSHRADFIITDG
jgi:pantothenate kinase